MDNQCFWGLSIFLFQNRSTVFRNFPPCRRLILYRFLDCLGIHYHQLECCQKTKTMKIISLNYCTGHIKKGIYVFQRNGNSFGMMIFITIIQLKIHKSNGFPKQRICFHCFYFNLSLLQNISLSGHISKKKQLHIFFQKQSLISFQKQPYLHWKTMKCF